MTVLYLEIFWVESYLQIHKLGSRQTDGCTRADINSALYHVFERLCDFPLECWCQFCSNSALFSKITIAEIVCTRAANIRKIADTRTVAGPFLPRLMCAQEWCDLIACLRRNTWQLQCTFWVSRVKQIHFRVWFQILKTSFILLS